MMFDIRRRMLVMRKSGRQRWIVGMRLRIVPVQLLAVTPDLVAVALQEQRPAIKGKAFSDLQPIAGREYDLAGQCDNRHPRGATTSVEDAPAG